MDVIREDLRSHFFGNVTHLDSNTLVNPMGEPIQMNLLEIEELKMLLSNNEVREMTKMIM
jgi:hypothetical protein